MLLNGGDTIPPITLTNPMMPEMGGRTFTRLTAVANEIARSRVLGGVHFSFSTNAAQTMGRQVGAHVVKVLGVGGCGVGKYAWGSACLPCQTGTYWDSRRFTDTCTPCVTGRTSPMGASACEPRLTVALRANDREFPGEPVPGEPAGDGGMMMPMAAASSLALFTAAGGSSKGRLHRKGRGVVQLVQRNPDTVPSGARAVVTVTLPPGVRYAGKTRIVPPLTSQASKAKANKPEVSGQTLTWRFAPLAAGQDRVFTIKVVVAATTASWLSFQASSYYLTDMDMSGMGEEGMAYGQAPMIFNVPIN